MRSSAYEGPDLVSTPIRCDVELSDKSAIYRGTVRMVRRDGMIVDVPPDQGERLSIGGILELHAEDAPVGPLRTAARIASLDHNKDHRGRAVVSVAIEFVDFSDIQRRALQRQLESVLPLVLTVGLEDSFDVLGRSFRVIEAASPDAVPGFFDQEDVAVLVLGPLVAPVAARDLLARIVDEFPGLPTVSVLLGAGADTNLFQPFVDNDRIYYLSRGPLTEGQIHAIVTAAAHRFRVRLEESNNALARSPSFAEGVLDYCVRLSFQTDLASAGALLVEAMKALLQAQRAYYLIYAPDKEILWSMDAASGAERHESAVAGIVSYVARTGERANLERIADDPRYDADADDPNGDPAAHLLAEPILGSSGDAIAVAIALRDPSQPRFSPGDEQTLATLAASVSPVLGAILMRQNLQQKLVEDTHAANEIFRLEALESNSNWENHGGLLKTSPLWLRRSHWITVTLLLAGLLFVILARVNEYATGPVVVRARSKVAVTSAASGLVRSVDVSAGDRVRLGDLLVRFHDSPGATTTERIREQLRAPADGIVNDIRVRAGQQLAAGDQVASIIDETGGYELIALLPGSYAPRLRTGMPLVLKLDGYQDSHESIPIDRVGEEIIGPREATRYAGGANADALTVAGSVIIVRSFPRSSRFTSGGRSFAYHDGMVGSGEVSVRTEPMILSLLPGLKEILRPWR